MQGELSLSLEQATAIIAEAKSDGVFTDPMPESDAERIECASDLYRKALDASKTVKAPVVHKIIAIVENNQPPFDTNEKKEEAAGQEEAEPKEEISFVLYEKEDSSKDQPAPEADPKSLPIDDFLVREKLLVPVDPDWELKPVPGDFTTLSDVEVRRLHSEYHGYFSRAAWLLVQEENDLNAADHMYNIAFSRAIKEIGGEKITAAKSEALFDAEVVSWKEKMLEHSANAKKLKALVGIYDSTCNRLSREWTMRSEERGSSGGLYGNR